MSNKQFFVLLVLLVVLQFVSTGFLASRLPAESETVYLPALENSSSGRSSSQPPPPAVVAIKLPAEEALRSAIRTVLEKELQAFLEQGSGSAPAKAAPPDPAITNPEANQRALRQSQEVIDLAISRQVWTNDDNAALMAYIPMLNDAQRQKLWDQLYGALERKAIELADGVAPMLKRYITCFVRK